MPNLSASEIQVVGSGVADDSTLPIAKTPVGAPSEM